MEKIVNVASKGPQGASTQVSTNNARPDDVVEDDDVATESESEEEVDSNDDTQEEEEDSGTEEEQESGDDSSFDEEAALASDPLFFVLSKLFVTSETQRNIADLLEELIDVLRGRSNATNTTNATQL